MAQIIGKFPRFEMDCFRCVSLIMVSLPFVIKRSVDTTIIKQNILYILGYTVLINIAHLAYYASAIYGPVATLDATYLLIAISFSAFISMVFKKQFLWETFVSVVICLVGVIGMIQPNFIFHHSEYKTTNWTNSSSHFWTLSCGKSGKAQDQTKHAYIPYILLTVSAVTQNLHFELVSRPPLSEVPFHIVAFFAGCFNLSTSLMFMLLFETPMMPSDPLCITLLVFWGLGAAQFFLCRNYSLLNHLQPLILNILYTLPLIILMFYQFTSVNQIHPDRDDKVEICGGVLCLIGALLAPVKDLVDKGCKKQDGDKEENINLLTPREE